MQARIQGGVGAHAPPPLSSTEYTFIYNFLIKYAPNCRKMHLKCQKFLGGMPSDPQGRTPAMSALPVYHPHPTPPPPSKILDPRLACNDMCIRVYVCTYACMYAFMHCVGVCVCVCTFKYKHRTIQMNPYGFWITKHRLRRLPTVHLLA